MIFLDRRRLRGLGETLAWLAGRRRRIRITGDSMLPTLPEGSFVLVDRLRRPEVGDLAVARHPTKPEVLVVKRVAAIGDDGHLDLASDNPAAGTDSRTWGPLPPNSVEGTVTLVLDRPAPEPGPEPGTRRRG